MAWPTSGLPPVFAVRTAGAVLYVVEIAASPRLMLSTASRGRHNYFVGGDDGDNAFATGSVWSLPPRAWASLQRARRLYYRVVAFDQRSGASAVSVADDGLDSLPSVRIGTVRLAVTLGLQHGRRTP